MSIDSFFYIKILALKHLAEHLQLKGFIVGYKHRVLLIFDLEGLAFGNIIDHGVSDQVAVLDH